MAQKRENARMDRDRRRSRRQVLKTAGTLAGCSALARFAVSPAAATPAAMQDAVRRFVGEAPVKKGKVKLDIPPIVENGNSVPCTVAVDSPMNATDYVKAIHVFNEKNPLPDIIGVTLGPRAGRAGFTTRIRLADSQTVTAIAELSDGTFWSGEADVIVTLAACLEETTR
jgi:sulfur-oxidizing protein SoxY